MDFFGHQRRARTRSARLVLAFAIALLAVVVATNAAAALAWWIGGGFILRGFPNGFFVTNSLVALLLVIGGAALQMWSLKAGGPAVASQLGARPLVPASSARDRMLRNVVEEVAIASAMPVPPVFVLDDDDAINALAAGFTPEDAAVVVTSGALARLNREELQGVLAHEFSHIANGDMRLNTQLVALLYGLELVPHLGRALLEAALDSAQRLFELSVLRGFAALLGVMLIVIGAVGLLAARIIKAAVSREREFLADAHAVQFTRSRDGIGGALRKVLALESRSGGRNAVHSAFAANVSHLFLTAAGERPGAMFASHPPIVERVRRIYGRRMPSLEPTAHEDFPDTAAPSLEPLAFDASALAGDGLGMGFAHGVSDRPGTTASAATAAGPPFGAAVAPGPNPAVTARLRGTAPIATDGGAKSVPFQTQRPDTGTALARLIQACDRPLGAQALLWALLALELTVDRLRLRFGPGADPALVREIERLLPAIVELEHDTDARWRVPLMELACARLARTLGKIERGVMLRGLHRLVASDRQVTVNEWMLLWVVQRRLAPAVQQGWAGARLRMSACVEQVARMARLLARVDGLGEAQAARRTEAVLTALGTDARTVARLSSAAEADATLLPERAPLPAVELALEEVEVAVARLAALWPHEKPRLIRALLLADERDGPGADGDRSAVARPASASRARLECLRALCSAIDCPPPAELTSMVVAGRGAAAAVRGTGLHGGRPVASTTAAAASEATRGAAAEPSTGAVSEPTAGVAPQPTTAGAASETASGEAPASRRTEPLDLDR